MTLAHPHATLLKFGYPGTLLHEGEHWAVLVRPAQPTLGSLVLCSTTEATAYGDLPPAAFTEQGQLVTAIERFLHRIVQPERINYLMLMMVDPQVHFHVLPRYVGNRTFAGQEFPDRGWPALPDLSQAVTASDALVDKLRSEWAELR